MTHWIDRIPAGTREALEPLVDPLGWTLVHFLWQGAALAALLAVARLMLRARSAQARYVAGCAAMFALVAAPVITFAVLASRVSQPVRTAAATPTVVPIAPVTAATRTDLPAPIEVATVANALPLPADNHPTLAPPPAAPAPAPSFTARLRPALPWLVVTWVVGVVALSIWHIGGYAACRRLVRSGTRAAPPEWQRRLASLACRLRISRPVRLLESARVAVPAVVGWLRPVILVPTSALSGLSPAQLEAILAHELAHIRRHDYLVNLLQALVETLLFYHPAVWWVSRQVRTDREDCCDDVAVAACGNPVLYARALATLEEMRQTSEAHAALPTHPALAATGARGGMPLLRRIRRLVAPPAQSARVAGRERRGALPAAAAALALVATLAVAVGLSVADEKKPARPADAPSATAPASDAKAPAPAQAAAATFPAPAGVVRDAEGRAVADAKVLLFYRNSFWGMDDRTAETVTTGADGQFRLTKPLTFKGLSNSDYTDHYILFAIHPDHAVAFASIFSGGPRPSYELTLTKPVQQTLLVTDREGKPLEGARVALGQAGDSDSPVPSLRDAYFMEGGPDELASRTGPDGRVTLKNLPDVRCAFHVTAPKYGRSWRHVGRPGRKDVETVPLTPAGSVAGSVKFADGKPVADAVVFFSAKWMHDGAWTRTDESGKYRIDHLIARGGSSSVPDGGSGAYDVSIRHDDCVTPLRQVELEPGASVDDFDLVATSGTLIKGKVLEPGTEKPIPGARVQALMGEHRFDAYADAAGEFRWRTPAGELTYFFLQPPFGYGVQDGHETKRITLTGDGEVPLTVYAPSALQRLVTARGRLTLPGGAPAAGALVAPLPTAELQTGGAYTAHTTATNADGTFELVAVANAPLDLYAETADRRFVFSTQATPGGGDAAAAGRPQDLGEFTMQPAVTAELLVTDVAGRPRANTRLRIHPHFDTRIMSRVERVVRTDAEGRLKLDGVVPGLTYLVHDGRWDLGDTEWLESFQAVVALAPEAAADPDQPTPLMLDNRVRVSVVDAAGEPVAVKRLISVSVLDNPAAPPAPIQPTPAILERLEDGSVLLAGEVVGLTRASRRMPARPAGAVLQIECETDTGRPVKASGAYDGSNRIELKVQ